MFMSKDNPNLKSIYVTESLSCCVSVPSQDAWAWCHQNKYGWWFFPCLMIINLWQSCFTCLLRELLGQELKNTCRPRPDNTLKPRLDSMRLKLTQEHVSTAPIQMFGRERAPKLFDVLKNKHSGRKLKRELRNPFWSGRTTHPESFAI